MSKTVQLLLGLFFVLAALTIGLFLLLRSKTNRAQDFATSPTTIGKDFEEEVVVEEITGSLVKAKRADGELKNYLLTSKVIYLCLPADNEYYTHLKKNERENVGTQYFITREEVSGKVKTREKVELFLYEHSPEKTFIKAIVDYDC